MAITTKHFFARNGMFSQSGSHICIFSLKIFLLKFEQNRLTVSTPYALICAKWTTMDLAIF